MFFGRRIRGDEYPAIAWYPRKFVHNIFEFIHVKSVYVYGPFFFPLEQVMPSRKCQSKIQSLLHARGWHQRWRWYWLLVIELKLNFFLTAYGPH
jgi:hypothetical protein